MAAALGLSAALAACQSAGIDDLAPSLAAAEPLPAPSVPVPLPSPAPAAPPAALTQTSAAGPVNTGQYPKFGNIPVPETAQLGAMGTAALRSELAAAKSIQSVPVAAPETYAEKMRRLRLLAASHGKDTLAEIEPK